uniref:Inter-alpha-trypsin inhibitor heavy chain 4 n=1 Tax=Prolemur simus TaxID=1328070 RepID=A0A8C8YS34_PROSS
MSPRPSSRPLGSTPALPWVWAVAGHASHDNGILPSLKQRSTGTLGTTGLHAQSPHQELFLPLALSSVPRSPVSTFPASRPLNDIDIYSLTVDSKVSSRFSHTVVTSRVVNRADTVQEATFQMELPRKAFITNFSMVMDGVTYPGNIKEKAAAQEQYSAAVAQGKSAGLVKATGRKTEQFQVSVSVAPSAKVTFELVYEELLRRHLGVYELLLKVQPQQPVKHLQMDIHIFEPQGISLLETESTFVTNELVDALTISQNATKAHILFKPTLSQKQKPPKLQDTVLDGSLIVRYDVNRTHSGGSIQNGYFVHYFAPEGLSTMPKNVVFVIDKSGSMSGRKIQQTREALIKILDDLSSKDQFNLIVFSGRAAQWKPALVPASVENVNEARSFASDIQAFGGTNINDAMQMAVQLLDSSNREELLPGGSVSLIILLTDGDPTEGEINPARIQENVREAIGGRYSVFCLGFGFHVSYAFLEKLALDNGGLARRIYEDSDSALQLQDFYQEVANPLLTAVAFEYPSNAVDEVTRENFPLFFKGSEMVVAGKLRDQSPDVLSAKVSGQTVSVAKPSSQSALSLRFSLCRLEGEPIAWVHRRDSMRQSSDSHETTCAVTRIGRHSALSLCTCEHKGTTDIPSQLSSPAVLTLAFGGCSQAGRAAPISQMRTLICNKAGHLPWAPLQQGPKLRSPHGAPSWPSLLCLLLVSPRHSTKGN